MGLSIWDAIQLYNPWSLFACTNLNYNADEYANLCLLLEIHGATDALNELAAYLNHAGFLALE